MENIFLYESFDESYYRYFVIEGHKLPRFFYSKIYDYSKKKWYIQTRIDNYFYGARYDYSLNRIDDISGDYITDNDLFYVEFAFLVALALWAILRPVVGEKRWQLKTKNSIVFSIIIILVSLFVIDSWMQLQLFWPLISFWILFLLIKIYKKDNIKNAISHLCVSFLFIIGWGYYQFFSLESCVNMSDGKTIQIHWRKGTDWTKRIIIKRIFRNMVPVLVTDHGISYTVYASKYEFTEGERAILNDDMFGSLDFFNDDALTGLSFREAQLILQKIENLSGVKLDFFTYPEWQSASLGVEHTCHEEKLDDVDEGEPNKFGLVNIASNAPEFTSSYYPTIKLGINADTLIGTVNNVYVAGGAYVSNDKVKYSIVDKSLRKGDVGLRLIYRPNGIGLRKFGIKGYKCKNNKDNNSPLKILVVSIDNRLITSFSNYESFEEYLIEHFYDIKRIEALNQQTKKVEKIIIPPGLGIYDFVPYFIFDGIKNENAVIHI